MSDLQVVGINSAEAQTALRNGSRPLVNERTGEVKIQTPRGLVVNSALRKDEWEELDSAIVESAVAPLNMVNRFRRAGLVRRLGSLGTLIAQYTQVSEMTAANISLSGTGAGAKDLVDFDLHGVPVPIIFKEFEINARYLQSSRLRGDGIDTVNARAAARVVGEKLEDLLVNGDTSINLNGSTIYGLTSHPDRNTDTAGNFGGGDFGTITNIIPTFSGMIAAARGDNYRGPYGVFVSDTQYEQMSHSFYPDGSSQNALQRVGSLPQISFIDPSAWLADGEILMVQMVPEVVEMAIVETYWPITSLEWTSGDGMSSAFKVLTVFAPIIKSDFSGHSGIVHCTGA